MKPEETIEFLKTTYSLWEGENIPSDVRSTLESETGLLIFQGVVAMSSVLLEKREQKILEKLFDENAPMHDIVHFLETHIEHFPELVQKVGSGIIKSITPEK